jgi:hypothetical protein
VTHFVRKTKLPKKMQNLNKPLSIKIWAITAELKAKRKSRRKEMSKIDVFYMNKPNKYFILVFL